MTASSRGRMDALPVGTAGRALHGLCLALAYTGGLILLVLILITLYSIVGRAIVGAPWLREVALLSWWRPFSGDFELVSVGTAAAIFAFLPYCQLMRGNVVVDFFTANAGRRTRALMAAFGDLLFLIVSAVLTWRMAVGAYDLASARRLRTSMILELPVWWGYIPGVLCLGVLTLVCAYTLCRSARDAIAPDESASGRSRSGADA